MKLLWETRHGGGLMHPPDPWLAQMFRDAVASRGRPAVESRGRGLGQRPVAEDRRPDPLIVRAVGSAASPNATVLAPGSIDSLLSRLSRPPYHCVLP